MNKILILLLFLSSSAHACKDREICVEFAGDYVVITDENGKETYHKYDRDDLYDEDELVDKLYKERYGHDDSLAIVSTPDRRLLPTVKRDGKKEK